MSPVHHSPVLLCILPRAESISNERSGLLLVDSNGYLEGFVHVVVFVEFKWWREFLE